MKDNNDWQRSVKYIYAYNANNNRVLEEHYDWNPDDNDWKGDYKYEWSVDNSGIYYYYLGSNWDINTKNWYIVSSGIYYFDGKPLSNENELFYNNYSVFPNPVTSENVLTVSSNNDNNFSYKIYSSNGRLVLEGVSKNKQKNIDVSSLSKGIYMLQVINKDGVLSSKFIK